MTIQSAKRGRPPKISREDIASAALKIGIGRATIRNVARELGVSVMGVYHHVQNADELLDLAMSHEMKELLGPVEGHGSFEEILFDAAQRYYDFLVGFPEMLIRLVGGQIYPRGTAMYYESLLTSGVSRGLTELEAFHVVRCVMTAAAGAAVTNVGGKKPAVPSIGEVLTAGVAEMKDGAAPYVESLLQMQPFEEKDPMEAVRMALLGLRETIGERMTATPGDSAGAARR